jgi:hypothetical protein
MERVFKLTKDVPSDMFLEIYNNFFYTGAMLDFDKIDDETLRVSTKKDSMVEDRDLEELEKNISAFANEAFLYDIASCY